MIIIKVNGVIVSGVKEIVINHSMYTKENETYWVHHGKHQLEKLSHNEMVRKIHGVMRSEKFSVWVSGSTINAINPIMYPRK